MRGEKGQIILTFDDGLACHLNAAEELSKRNLLGTFGVVSSKIGDVGFLSWDSLNKMRDDKHFICNHSFQHLWSGQGQPKPNIVPKTQGEITEDYQRARGTLNKWGYNGDYLLLPFGSTNIFGPDHLEDLLKYFKWIRMSVGAPAPKDMGSWILTGGKRLWPRNYSGPTIGVSVAADTRSPNGVKKKIEEAAACGAICVVTYHSVCDVVGETQQVTWNRFIDDINYMKTLVYEERLECILPNQLVER